MSGTDFRATLLTPSGPGGIAVVALQGPGRFRLAACLLCGAEVDEQPRLRWLWCDGERLDQVVVVERPAHDSIEVHLHASPAVLRALDRLIGGLVSASPSPREQALRGAMSVAQLDFALDQQRWLAPFGGSFAAWLSAHAGDAAALRAAYARRFVATAMTVPFAVALFGRKNVGKSTLMNRLLLAERVLTGPAPGLTRDPVREIVTLEGYPYELIDTAGEGDIVDAVDARAIALSRTARAPAMQVLVVDASAGFGGTERSLLAQCPAALVLRTKMDLDPAPWPEDLPLPGVDVSCAGDDIAPLVRVRVGAWFRRLRGLPTAGPLDGVAPLDDHECSALYQTLVALEAT